jgi:hypothetical protein
VADLNLKSFDKLYPMVIHKYEDLIPNNDATIMEKLNSIIDYLNKVGKLTNDVVKDWNVVYQWVMNDGLTADVSAKLDDMVAKGTFDTIFQNEITPTLGNPVNLNTTAKVVVDAVNELLVKITANTTNITTNTTNIASNTASLAEKAIQINTVADLKARNASVGDIIQTKGYYAVGDNGHATYQIVSSGVADDGNIIALTNGKFAQLLHNGTIHARQYGVKLDNVTDDTARLNAFFKMFGTVELIVAFGVARTTGQLFLGGMWNPPTNNGKKKIVFKNAPINYQGVSGKACIHIYNHQKSVIDGLSYLKTSVSTSINFVGCWYNEIVNFDIPKITFNKNNSDITDTLITTDSYSNVFRKGVTYQEFELYGVGTTGGGNINSISFENILFQGNQIAGTQYNFKFYGTSFQNIAFYSSDLSYSSLANIYIDVTQPNMKISFYSCYFDSPIPLVVNNDYKGAVINNDNYQISNGQLFRVKTKNQLSNVSQGGYGLEGGTPKHGGLNLAKNGDLFYPTLSGWQYSGNNTSGGGIGAPIAGFINNVNAINKNSLQVMFQQTNQYQAFTALNAPMDAPYTMAVRLRKLSGNGSIQLQFKTATPTFDLTPFALNEELILSANTGSIITQGTSLFGTLMCTLLTTNPLIIEILEVVIVPSTNIGINLSVHPQANVYPISGTTANRPHTYNVLQNYYDMTIGKPIWVKYQGFREVDTLTINSGANASGNITVTLNGVTFTVAVTAGDTAGAIGDKIRATTMSGWIVSGTGGSATVTFTKQSSGTNTSPTFADTGATGATGTFAVTTAGANPTWSDSTGTTV